MVYKLHATHQGEGMPTAVLALSAMRRMSARANGQVWGGRVSEMAQVYHQLVANPVGPAPARCLGGGLTAYRRAGQALVQALQEHKPECVTARILPPRHHWGPRGPQQATALPPRRYIGLAACT